MSFPQWQPGQASPEVPVNEAFDILKFLSVFGRDPETTTGLTWGYLGGPWGNLTITTGTVSLTASSVNYLVVNRSTGVVSVSTTTTNWDDTVNYARIFAITTSSLTATSFVDHRGGLNGVLGPKPVLITGLPTASGGDLLQYNSVSGAWEAASLEEVLPAATDGDLLRYNGTTNEWEVATLEGVLPAATDGDLLRYNGTTNKWESVTLEQVLPVASTNDTLVFNGTAWVADAPSGGGGGGSSLQAICIACGAENEPVSSSTFVEFRMPYNMALTNLKASVTDPGDGVTGVYIYVNGSSITSNPIYIDAFERSSKTASTPFTITVPNLTEDSEVEIFTDGVSSNALGLKVYLIGTAS